VNNSPHVPNSISQILGRALRGLVSGFAGGVLAGALGSFAYWTPTKHLYPSLYGDIDIGQVVGADVLLIGIPIGLAIGIGTGLQAAVFRQHAPRMLLWVPLSGTSAVLAVWLSAFRVNNPAWFLLLVAFVGSATGWLSHKLAMHKHEAEPPRLVEVTIGIVSGFLLMFLMIYAYFRVWVYLQSIPS